MIRILARAALLLPLASIGPAWASEDASHRHSDHGYGRAHIWEGRGKPRREWLYGRQDRAHSHRRHMREED